MPRFTERDPMTPETGLAEPGGRSSSTALHSLIVDEGVGTLLGLATGDVAAHGDGYSSRTQIAMVLAYHLIGRGAVDRSRLVEELLELGRPESSVLVDPSPALSAWLAEAAEGRSMVMSEPTAEVLSRAVPIGVWCRNDPDALVTAVLDVALAETSDALSIAGAVAVGGAIAASTLAMSGWDLVLAASETTQRALGPIAQLEVANLEAAADLPGVLAGARSGVGDPLDAVVTRFASLPEPLRFPLAAIVIAADPVAEPGAVVESAAVHGVDASVVAGSILGARLGLRRWPWRVPNETWFAEIGRRLVRRERDTSDLPVPRAVEERVRGGHPADPVRTDD